MAQTELLMDALKRQLRSAGVTYAQVAAALELSEASIKRLMSSGDLSLDRVQAICALCGIDLFDLVQVAERERRSLSQLDESLEAELVADEKLLLVTYLVLNDWSMAQVLTHYQFTEPELIRLLIRLDRMRLIDLLPGNRIRLRTARDFAWRPGGPIQQFFDMNVRESFFAGDFRDEGYQRFLPSMVTRATAEKIRERLLKTAQDIGELVRFDASQPAEQREGCSVLLAFRLWGYPGFARWRREPNS
ncbi:XRE family transcriptional regulator [Permianibacter sp. IMCC34836]|uniref:XRE family transcriptional regulator n=1 Tax=Permianibacter fluminis TaxID=2738515 RepID=UPI00155382B9|nr:XRE family transcriptional regulator [Permianibacter fluminis]NQD35455.1 XRE family transcriptional regulator [Permianibacter fluminis]